MNEVRLDLFGSLEMRMTSGAALPLPARKAAALLAYLALHPGRLQPRERLVALFWEGGAEPQARACLRQALALLRRDVPGFADALCAGGDAVALRPGWAATDVAAFEAAAAAPERLAEAASLYRGELLAGLHLRSAAFEAWLLPERSRLHGRAMAALRGLLDQGAGDAEEHVALALRLLQLDPAQEEVHRALMRLHARRGRHEAALRQFQVCRDALRRELDVAPGAETEQLLRDIRARRIAGCRHPVSAVPPNGNAPELRFVTVMHVEAGAGRLRGGPEALQQVQAALLRAVRHSAELHAGIASAGLGPAAVAVFGSTIARADDARRGVRAALETHARLGPASPARIGVACGNVVVGDGAPEGGFPALAGDVLDQARRLAARVGWGQVAVSGLVRDAAADHDWEAMSDERSDSWRLRGLAAEDDPWFPPFVGRAAELAEFDAVLAGLNRSGRGRAVVVRGEAGLGKTRLVERCEQAATRSGLRCHAAVFPDARSGDLRNVVPALLRSLLEAVDDRAAETAVERAVAVGWIAEDDRGTLRDVLGLPPAGGQALGGAALDDGVRREVIGAIVRAASARAPRMLVTEDVHRADGRALADVAAIAAAVPDARAVLVMTLQGRSYPYVAAPPAITLDLAPLRPDEAETLVGSSRDVARSPARACLHRAGGHPLFLAELLRCNWREGDSLPAVVRSAVLAQLDVLDPADRAALQAASALGQRFPEPLLRYVLDQPGYACTALVSRMLLQPCREGLLFAQALVRDVVYDLLPRGLRRRWRLRATEWLAGRDPPLRAERQAYAREGLPACLSLRPAVPPSPTLRGRGGVVRWVAPIVRPDLGVGLSDAPKPASR